jgi:hypothetical protein
MLWIISQNEPCRLADRNQWLLHHRSRKERHPLLIPRKAGRMLPRRARDRWLPQMELPF